MKTQSSIVALAMIGSLFLSGCGHSNYLSNSHNVPMLTARKDVQISIAAFTGGPAFTTATGIELQGSYALTNKIGIMLSGIRAAQTKNAGYFEFRYIDFGGGYFTASKSKHFVFETYCAIGSGYAENDYGNGYSKASFTKLYVQPAIGYKSRNFVVAFSWRFASVHYSSIESTGSLQTPGIWGIPLDYAFLLQVIQTQPNLTRSEPAITLRFGEDNFKIQVQAGFSSVLDGAKSSESINTHLSIGAFITIHGKVNVNKKNR